MEQQVKLANYTTLGVGGPSKYFLRASKSSDLLEGLNFAKENNLPILIIGGGSNLLISDEGFPGLTILNRFNESEIGDDYVIASSGTNITKLARELLASGFLGLEFAIGIPGSVGGAVIGNAGTAVGDIASSLVSADIWEDGAVKTITNDDFNFGYRFSKYKTLNNAYLINVKFKIRSASIGELADAREKVEEDKIRRSKNYVGKTAGSYFKNPAGERSAGELIELAGLKGYVQGGARVSMEHANVIQNFNKATAKDIFLLEKKIIESVKDEFGVTLEPEVVKVGKF